MDARLRFTCFCAAVLLSLCIGVHADAPNGSTPSPTQAPNQVASTKDTNTPAPATDGQKKGEEGQSQCDRTKVAGCLRMNLTIEIGANSVVKPSISQEMPKEDAELLFSTYNFAFSQSSSNSTINYTGVVNLITYRGQSRSAAAIVDLISNGSVVSHTVYRDDNGKYGGPLAGFENSKLTLENSVEWYEDAGTSSATIIVWMLIFVVVVSSVAYYVITRR